MQRSKTRCVTKALQHHQQARAMYIFRLWGLRFLILWIACGRRVRDLGDCRGVLRTPTRAHSIRTCHTVLRTRWPAGKRRGCIGAPEHRDTIRSQIMRASKRKRNDKKRVSLISRRGIILTEAWFHNSRLGSTTGGKRTGQRTPSSSASRRSTSTLLCNLYPTECL